jgi:DNA repair protein RadC
MSRKVKNESAPAYNTAHANSDASLCAQLGIDLTQYTSLRDAARHDAKLLAAQELTRRVLLADLGRGNALGSPTAVREFLALTLRDLRNEAFHALWLDNQHRVIASEELFRGTIDSTAVYPRVVVERAIHHNAAAVIFAHNHPSGVAEPSLADKQITRRLKDALALIDVRTLDHFVVCDTTVSLAERGLV